MSRAKRAGLRVSADEQTDEDGRAAPREVQRVEWHAITARRSGAGEDHECVFGSGYLSSPALPPEGSPRSPGSLGERSAARRWVRWAPFQGQRLSRRCWDRTRCRRPRQRGEPQRLWCDIHRTDSSNGVKLAESPRCAAGCSVQTVHQGDGGWSRTELCIWSAAGKYSQNFSLHMLCYRRISKWIKFTFSSNFPQCQSGKSLILFLNDLLQKYKMVISIQPFLNTLLKPF